MKSRYPIVAAVAVLSLLLAGNVSDVYAADFEPTADTCDPAGATPNAATLDRASAEDPEREAACYTSYPNDCGDYPKPVGWTCSCSTQLIAHGCNSCETGQAGAVLITTCEVCPGSCQNPPCQIQLCQEYDSPSCHVRRS